MTSFARFISMLLCEFRALRWAYIATRGVSKEIQTTLGFPRADSDAIVTATRHLVLAKQHRELAQETLRVRFRKTLASRVMSELAEGVG